MTGKAAKAKDARFALNSSSRILLKAGNKRGDSMDDNYGVEIPVQVSELLKCGLCHFCHDEKDRGLVCVHPEGAAIKRYPEQPTGFNRGIICKNWQEDYPVKLPAHLFKNRK